MAPAAAVACTVDTKTSRSYRVRSWVAIQMLPCAFVGCLTTVCILRLGLPSTCYRVRSWVASNQPPPNQPHPPSSTCYRVRSWVASSPAHPATNPTGHPPNQHQPQSHPPMPSTCYRAHSWVASALSWLGPLWHWVVCGIGQLHPVHPCFTAQLLCAVLLRSQDRNRLRTPRAHHLIIHHHLCRKSKNWQQT